MRENDSGWGLRPLPHLSTLDNWRMTLIYVLYFITVAVLGTAIFRLFAERDFWQDEFHDLSAAYVAEVKDLEAENARLETENARLMTAFEPILKHIETGVWGRADLEHRLDASSKRIEALYTHFDQD